MDYSCQYGQRLIAPPHTHCSSPISSLLRQAICANPEIQYSIVKYRNEQSDSHFIVASERLSEMQHALKKEFEVCTSLPGSSIVSATYIHPFDGRELSILPGAHVTTESGTGLVHTAPAHGKVLHFCGAVFILTLGNFQVPMIIWCVSPMV